MKTRIALGAALLLTLGTSVAGSMMYSRGQADIGLDQPVATARAEVPPSPEMIAMWKATAASSDYIAPKVPI